LVLPTVSSHEETPPFSGRRLRVGLLANTFDDVFGAVAGGHVHFIEVAKRWSDYDLMVFAPELARDVIARELPRAVFVPMPSGQRFLRTRVVRNLYRTVASVRQRRLLRTCDVVIATSHFLPDIVPACFAGKRSIACVQHLLDPPGKRPGSFLANTVSTVFQALSVVLIRRFSGALLVNGMDVADRVGFGNGARIYVMTHGVEHLIDAQRTVAERDVRTVIYLGRLVETKGVDELIKAWALVLQAVPDARLVIAGTGPPKFAEGLRKQTEVLGIERSVEFCGFVTEQEKNERLDQASVFAFPSKEEGWGIVLAEAMAHGLACVTYDLPAYRHVFTSGRRWAALGDVAGFARSIVELLTSDGLRSELSAEALDLSAGFSWERAAAIERRAVEDVAADAARGVLR
jgi:glycosyltransferase involved in cell wall biosynthesis